MSMIKNLLSIVLLVLIHSASFSQHNDFISADLVGNWHIDKIEVTSLSEANDVNTENCYWANVKSLNEPVAFNEDGTVKFLKVLHDEKPSEVTAQYEISE